MIECEANCPYIPQTERLLAGTGKICMNESLEEDIINRLLQTNVLPVTIKSEFIQNFCSKKTNI